MTLRFIDTHCHLDTLKSRPLDDLIQDSLGVGVQKFVTIGAEKNHLPHIIELSQKYDMVYCTLGIHPHDAKDFTQELSLWIQEQFKDPKINSKLVAIGEIGLDYHYDHSPREWQRKIFEDQMSLAERYQLPVVIHTREADDDTWDILKNFNVKGVLHSFTSSPELAEKSIEKGYKIGFNGIVTFKNAQNVRDVLERVPLENIVIETDSPYLAPIPHRGKENLPLYIPVIFEKICQVKNISGEEEIKNFSEELWKNSHGLFPKIL
jgi:TatD DNase family protein